MEKILNLGCGTSKISGAINIDTAESVAPDVIHDLRNPLPFEYESVDKVCLFHTIEHIEKRFHHTILENIYTVLKPDGVLLISYPEFTTCVENWKSNHKGIRHFWEATLFGRQLYSSDYHVCIMHTPDFIGLLKDVGFYSIVSRKESPEEYNTIIKCSKGRKPYTYEELIVQDAIRLVKGE